MGLKHISRRDIDSNPLYYRGTSGRHVYDFSSLPSLDKGKHACQRVFPALFVLFALAGASPPASQKPKITRKYIAGGCGAVLPEQKCVQTRKGPQRILAVLSRGLTQYGRISARQNRICPCQSMVAVAIRNASPEDVPLFPVNSIIFGFSVTIFLTLFWMSSSISRTVHCWEKIHSLISLSFISSNISEQVTIEWERIYSSIRSH